jgi:hypothetical protein
MPLRGTASGAERGPLRVLLAPRIRPARAPYRAYRRDPALTYGYYGQLDVLDYFEISGARVIDGRDAVFAA